MATWGTSTPTLIADLKQDDELIQTEIFGPVVAGRDPAQGRHRLAGVVSGLSRQGDTTPPTPPTVI
jgi:hypothetical protein